MENVTIDGFVRDYTTTANYLNIAPGSFSEGKAVISNHHYYNLLQSGNSPTLELTVNYRIGQELIKAIIFYYKNLDDLRVNNPSGERLQDSRKYLVRVSGVSAVLEELQ